MIRQAIRQFNGLFIALFLAPLLMSCGASKFEVRSVSQFGSIDLGDLDPLDPEGDSDLASGDFELSICSDLSFENIEWSDNVTVNERQPFALALNVTGSFEGVSGWDNLTGNFDGQGISMGLLQWNLGQGSLQPMWTDMFNRYPSQVAPLFTGAQVASMKSMLTTWGSTISIAGGIRLQDYGYNELDDPEIIARDLGVSVDDILMMTVALTAKNQLSVNWAKANLLSGTSVKSDWSTRLKNLSQTQGYRSIQAGYASKLHEKAMEYFKLYKATQVRSYLVFFDIVVQNGGISSTVYSEYQAWLTNNSSANEYTRMKRLIELRAAKSAAQWRADVLSRKMTLLNGTGTVHGAVRDLNKEYCTNISAGF